MDVEYSLVAVGQYFDAFVRADKFVLVVVVLVLHVSGGGKRQLIERDVELAGRKVY